MTPTHQDTKGSEIGERWRYLHIDVYIKSGLFKNYSRRIYLIQTYLETKCLPLPSKYKKRKRKIRIKKKRKGMLPKKERK